MKNYFRGSNIKNLFCLLFLGTIFSCQEDEDSVSTFTDTRDGHVYKSVQIGTQVWMAENLDYRTAENSWYYNDDSVTYHIYGRLYTWDSALTAAPPGWHLPTFAEWTTLTEFLEGEDVAGGQLKEKGISHWADPNKGATNRSGFAALPGGYLNSDGSFYTNGYYGYWWSSTENNEFGSWYTNMKYDNAAVYRGNNLKTSGYSVRCVQD